MKPILKNTHKYTDIKLAKGINLEKAEIFGRYRLNNVQTFSGISSKIFADKWFYLPKGRAIFKTYETQEETKNNRIVNELICQELAKQVGLACAEYEPASYKGFKGLVSYDVTKDNETLISGKELCLRMGFPSCSNSVYQYKDVFKRYKMLNPQIEVKQLILDLYKIVIFDALTFQTDRHQNNVFFIKDKYGKLRVSPIIDNELSFSGNHLLISTMLNTLYRSDLLENHVDTDKVLSVYKNQKLTNYENYINDVLTLAKTNKEAREIVDNFIKKMNIKQAIENVEKMGIKINDGYKEYLTKLVGISKRIMRAKLREFDNINNTQIQNNQAVNKDEIQK